MDDSAMATKLARSLERQSKLKAALDRRNQQHALMKDRLAQQDTKVAGLKEQLSLARADRDANAINILELKQARRSTLAMFGMFSAQFADGVSLRAESCELQPPSIVLAHEDLALQALLATECSSHAVRLFDNVELPDWRHRTGYALVDETALMNSAFNAILAFKKSALRQVDSVFVSSEGQASALSELNLYRNPTLLRNARDGDHEAPAKTDVRGACGLGPGARVVVYLNNIYDGGGAESAIEALHHLPPGHHLVFLGEDRTTGRTLRQSAERLGPLGRYHFLDPRPPEELVSFISGADVILIPLDRDHINHRSCLPNRLFEAIKATVPIVATAGTETGVFVEQHQVGVTTEVSNPVVLAESILAVLARPPEHDHLIKVAQQVSWSKEQGALLDRLPESDSSAAWILANKRVHRNDRIRRIAATLSGVAQEVHVFARNTPDAGFRASGVRYHAVDVL